MKSFIFIFSFMLCYFVVNAQNDCTKQCQITAGRWYASQSAAGAWIPLATSEYPIESLFFGDFIGDSKTDVFVKDGNRWLVSQSGTGPWVQLATSGYNVTDLRFGDFVGDSKTDVFVKDGNRWLVSQSGTGPWVQLATSGYNVNDLRFGDFVGDSKTDVFVKDQNKWLISQSGTGPWVQLATSGYNINDLRFGDFIGNGKTDVFVKSTYVVKTGTLGNMVTGSGIACTSSPLRGIADPAISLLNVSARNAAIKDWETKSGKSFSTAVCVTISSPSIMTSSSSCPNCCVMVTVTGRSCTY